MRELKDYFCTYEQSLKLKKLGFDEECICVDSEIEDYFMKPVISIIEIDKTGEFVCRNSEYKKAGLLSLMTVPLRSQALDFFRDKFKLHSWVETQGGYYSFYNYVIYNRLETISSKCYIKSQINTYKTYHEAESALIDKLIELETEAQHGN